MSECVPAMVAQRILTRFEKLSFLTSVATNGFCTELRKCVLRVCVCVSWMCVCAYECVCVCECGLRREGCVRRVRVRVFV